MDLAAVLDDLIVKLKVAEAVKNADTTENRNIEGLRKLLNEREDELKEWLGIHCEKFNQMFYLTELLKVLNPWYCRGDGGMERNCKLAKTLQCREDVASEFLYTLNSLNVVNKIEISVATLEKAEEWCWYIGIVAGSRDDYEGRFGEHCNQHGTLYESILAECENFDLTCLAEMTGIIKLKQMMKSKVIRSTWNDRNGYDSAVLTKAKTATNFYVYLLRTKALYEPIEHAALRGKYMKLREDQREEVKLYYLNNASNCVERNSNLEPVCSSFDFGGVCGVCDVGFDTMEGKLYQM